MTTVPLVSLADPPVESARATLSLAPLTNDSAVLGASPTAAYPTAFLRPDQRHNTGHRPVSGPALIRADASTAAAAAAFTDTVPARDSDSLAARLKAMEDMATLWHNDGAKIFVGLDDDGHPGIHLKNRDQD